jgi:hypothetical protein
MSLTKWAIENQPSYLANSLVIACRSRDRRRFDQLCGIAAYEPEKAEAAWALGCSLFPERTHMPAARKEGAKVAAKPLKPAPPSQGFRAAIEKFRTEHPDKWDEIALTPTQHGVEVIAEALEKS